MQEETEGFLPYTRVFMFAQHVSCGGQICRSCFEWLNKGICFLCSFKLSITLLITKFMLKFYCSL